MYSIYFISNKPHLFKNATTNLGTQRVTYYDGSGHTSFSQVVNRCVASAGTEVVILMSDKVSPGPEHVAETLSLLRKGYAFVALYRFAFFGLTKELFRRIGPLDEGHVGGGFEDDDYYIRLVEADLSMWVTHTVPYTERPSSWNPDRAREYHYSKWRFDNSGMAVQRCLPEPSTSYNFGPKQDTVFLPGRKYSVATPPQVGRYLNLNFIGS